MPLVRSRYSVGRDHEGEAGTSQPGRDLTLCELPPGAPLAEALGDV